MSRDTMQAAFERAAEEWQDLDRWERIMAVCDEDDAEAIADWFANLVVAAEAELELAGLSFLAWIDRRLAKDRENWEARRAEEIEEDSLSGAADHYVDLAKEETP